MRIDLPRQFENGGTLLFKVEREGPVGLEAIHAMVEVGKREDIPMAAATTKRFLVKVGGFQRFTCSVQARPCKKRAPAIAAVVRGARARWHFAGARFGRRGRHTGRDLVPCRAKRRVRHACHADRARGTSSWDLAHRLRATLVEGGVTDVQAIEPDLEQAWVTDDPAAPRTPFAAAAPFLATGRIHKMAARFRMWTVSPWHLETTSTV